MRRAWGAVLAAVVTVVLAVTVLVAVPAEARRSGPKLTVTQAQADRALRCHGRLDRGATPILFLHGTTSDSEANWSWTWNRAARQQGWSYCNLDLPESGNGDLQVSAEYVVRSIRSMHERAGRRISIVGHSQGGMLGRWALKYWPDTRAMVSDYVGLASSNHGSTIFGTQCGVTYRCSAASWQQRTDATFIAALNDGPETWPGIDYTSISTNQDEVVVPSTSAWLRGGQRKHVTNVSVQHLCPTEVVDHFGLAYDNAAWLIGLDALTHTGPARLSRISTATCGTPLMPAVDQAAFLSNLYAVLVQTGTSVAASEVLPREPALRAYAR